MNWYRVELNEDGALLGCARITSTRIASRLIYFVKAQTEEEAIEKLLARRKKRLETKRRDEKAFREQCAVSGMCTMCGKYPPTPGYARCVTCRKYAADHMQRQRDGLIVKPHARTQEEQVASELFEETNRKARNKARRAKNKEYDDARKARDQARLADLGGTGTLRTWRARAALTLQLIQLFDGLTPQQFREQLIKLSIDCHAKGNIEPPAIAQLSEPVALSPVRALLQPHTFRAGRKPGLRAQL